MAITQCPTARRKARSGMRTDSQMRATAQELTLLATMLHSMSFSAAAGRNGTGT
jgi:hypothetical protein